MRILTLAALTALALSTAACTRPDRFGGDGSTDPNAAAGMGAGGVGVSGLGDPNDPNSPAYFQAVIGDRVLFAVDQSVLSPEAMLTLDGQAQWLIGHGYNVVIEGHADEQGTREYNLALGARRANAVFEYLVSKGVNASQLRTISYGKERPVATCAADTCYSQNRRAVTAIQLGM